MVKSHNTNGVGLEIEYRDRRLKQLCEVQASAERQLGPLSAKKLRIRLAALEAADRVTDLVAGNPHPLHGDRDGQFALDLAGGLRLVFSPAHDPCPCRRDGGIEWSQVTTVCIEFLGNYHE
jgi:toxin HigB-1